MNILEARRRTLGKGVYKKTVEGNPAIAQGSLARMYPGITMQGWTEQAQYEGKNLFDISDFETNNKGIIENGTILFKQSLGTVTYYLSLSPGTYSISIKRSGYSGIDIKVNEVAVINNGGGNNLTNNFDVSDGDSVVLEFSEGQNPNGEDRMIYDIMLNSGSAPLPYEPYTGGQPSPNPDYPQPITSAGNWNEEAQKWEYEIEVGGANLWSFEQSIEFERSVRLSFNRELPAGEYTFSAVVHSTDTDSSQCLLILLTADGGKMAHYIGRSDGNSRVSVRISISKPAAEISLYASTLNVTSQGDTASFDDIMFNIGDTALPYEPYHLPQTVTLTSDRPLTKWDKLENRNGQWGWVYKSDVLEYDGDEGWIYDANNLRGEYSALYYYDTRVLNKDYSYCDKFGHIVYPYDGEGIMDNYGASSGFYISIKSNRLASTDADGFKQWLQSNPLTVWYETAEETFVPLSESEQEQMNALHTYYPTTVLSNDCECNMSLTYKTKKSMGGG